MRRIKALAAVACSCSLPNLFVLASNQLANRCCDHRLRDTGHDCSARSDMITGSCKTYRGCQQQCSEHFGWLAPSPKPTMLCGMLCDITSLACAFKFRRFVRPCAAKTLHADRSHRTRSTSPTLVCTTLFTMGAVRVAAAETYPGAPVELFGVVHHLKQRQLRERILRFRTCKSILCDMMAKEQASF